MRPVVEVRPDGTIKTGSEEVLVVLVVEAMRRRTAVEEAPQEFVPRTAELGEVVDSHTNLVVVPGHCREERETMPDADVHECVLRVHPTDDRVEDSREGEPAHPRYREQRCQQGSQQSVVGTEVDHPWVEREPPRVEQGRYGSIPARDVE